MRTTSKNSQPRKAQARGRSARPRPAAAAQPVVYVLSDSTGNLARHMLAALLTQFPPGSIVPQYYTFLRTEHRLAEVLERIKSRPGPICHAMISEAFKRRVADFCKRERIPHRDLTRGLEQFLFVAF